MAAGGAAHLAGVVAALTTLPVIAVPMATTVLNGMDSLLSTVQMPAGVPVAAMAIDKPGAVNAGIYAAEIVATFDPRVAHLLTEYKRELRTLGHGKERARQTAVCRQELLTGDLGLLFSAGCCLFRRRNVLPQGRRPGFGGFGLRWRRGCLCRRQQPLKPSPGIEFRKNEASLRVRNGWEYRAKKVGDRFGERLVAVPIGNRRHGLIADRGIAADPFG